MERNYDGDGKKRYQGQRGGNVYTPELAKRIINAIKFGNTVQDAAEMHKVCKETIMQWTKRGKDPRSNFHEFYLGYKEAQASHAAHCRKKMEETGKDDWKMWRYKGYCVSPHSFPPWSNKAAVKVNVNSSTENPGTALFKAFEKAQKKYNKEQAKKEKERVWNEDGDW